MSVTFGALVLKVSNISRAAEFWSKALGYVPQEGRRRFVPADAPVFPVPAARRGCGGCNAGAQLASPGRTMPFS